MSTFQYFPCTLSCCALALVRSVMLILARTAGLSSKVSVLPDSGGDFIKRGVMRGCYWRVVLRGGVIRGGVVSGCVIRAGVMREGVTRGVLLERVL